MSLEEVKPTSYGKFVWKTKLSSQLENNYSDQFQIDNLENVIFNIGLQFPTASLTSFNVWVKKSNLEPACATIKMMVGNVKSEVETQDWKDVCNVGNNLDLCNETQKRYLSDGNYSNYYYYYDITITCEIYWKSIIKRCPENNLYDEMKHFYNSEELSDVTLIIDKVKIPSHKVVLSAHSPVFLKMLQAEMKEAKENEINIEDLDGEIILEMLNYCYKGETKASYDTEVALQMLEAADKYQIMKLKEICEVTLLNNISVDNVLNIIDAADDHHSNDLRNSAIKFIVSNRKKIFASNKFQQLFYRKRDLMFELMCAVGNE